MALDKNKKQLDSIQGKQSRLTSPMNIQSYGNTFYRSGHSPLVTGA